jgi:hypothetical protein
MGKRVFGTTFFNCRFGFREMRKDLKGGDGEAVDELEP